MALGEAPEERRGDVPSQHVAAVWAAPIADLDPVGLFQLGAACLDLAESTDDPERSALLAGVGFGLLVYAGSNDPDVGTHISRLCERERRAEGRAETARVIADLEVQFGSDAPD